LWHWPLLSIPRIIKGETPSAQVRISAVLLSILMAWLTYRLVEKPIRGSLYTKTVTTGLLAAMLIVGCVGYFTYAYEGLTARAATTPVLRNDGDVGHVAFHQYASKHFFPCTPLSVRKEALFFGDSLRCLQSKEDKPVDLAIIGDSHAEHLFPGFAEELADRNVAYYIKTTLPVVRDKEFTGIFQYVLSDPNIKVVILAAAWHIKQVVVPKDSSFERELSATVTALGSAGKTVYIVDDVPSFPFDPKQCKYSRAFSDKNNCVQDRGYFDFQHGYYPILESVEQSHSHVKLLGVEKYFCDSQVCSMAKDGKLLYRDQDHLNLNGTRYLAKRIVGDNPGLR
jgi:SGNH domain (fused to AT3 domains)